MNKKYYLWTVLCCLIQLSLFAQKSGNCMVDGFFKDQYNTKLSFTGPGGFQKTVITGPDGKFSQSVEVDSAYYFLDTRIIYLQPGYHLTLQKVDTVYRFKGSGSTENEYLSRITQLQKQYFQNGQYGKPDYMEPPQSFINITEQFKAAAMKILADLKAGPFFVRTQQLNLDYMVRYYLLNFMTNYGLNQAKRQEAMDYMIRGGNGEPAEIKARKFAEMVLKARELTLNLADRQALITKIWTGFDYNNQELYNFSSVYRSLLDRKISQLVMADRVREPLNAGKSEAEISLEMVAGLVSRPDMREQLYFQIASKGLRSSKNKEQVLAKYQSLAREQYYLNKISALYNPAAFRHGTNSADFSYPNVSGRNYSLRDFRGKYLYIDLWATWCMPCINEMPALKTIQDKYRGKNIAFLSISIDKQDKLDVWKQMVADKQLSGLQLIAGQAFESPFLKQYNVVSIPRFILLDPAGKIIDADAARPLDPALISQLDKLLPDAGK